MCYMCLLSSFLYCIFTSTWDWVKVTGRLLKYRFHLHTPALQSWTSRLHVIFYLSELLITVGVLPVLSSCSCTMGQMAGVTLKPFWISPYKGTHSLSLKPVGPLHFPTHTLTMWCEGMRSSRSKQSRCSGGNLPASTVTWHTVTPRRPALCLLPFTVLCYWVNTVADALFWVSSRSTGDRGYTIQYNGTP